MARYKLEPTQEQQEWLKANWATKSNAQLVRSCGCSLSTLARWGRELGLPNRQTIAHPWQSGRKNRASRQLTEPEVAWLKENWVKLSPVDTAKHLGVSVSTLRRLIAPLGLPGKRGDGRAKADTGTGTTYNSRLPFALRSLLGRYGIKGLHTYADAFDVLASYNIHPFVRPWQLTPGNRYYCGECVGPDGSRRSGGVDYPTWHQAARTALNIASHFLATIYNNLKN